jgi:ankyrin repeat protein
MLVAPLCARAQETDRAKLSEQLWEAARTGDAATARSLLERGADVNARFRYGQTPLFKAAERGHAEVVRLLLERGADANLKDTFYGATPMTWAVDKGHAEVVRALLEKGAEGSDEALMGGVRRDNLALVRAALDAGKPKPETLSAALVAATGANKAEIAEALRKAGAKPPIEVDAATLQSYTGSYKNEQGFEVVVAVKDGRLTITPTGQQPLVMMPLDNTTFRPTEFDGLTISMIAEGGKVTGFNLKQGANTTLFKRQ